MEVWVLVSAVSAAVSFVLALVLALRLVSVRHSLKEISKGLEDRLSTDTNTLISVSCGDRAVRALASKLNTQLETLRAQRLRYENGDSQLKDSMTNLSHDIRTPLTAICGYLDLLESQPLSDEQSRYLAVVRERTNAMKALTEELLQYSVTTSSIGSLEMEPVCMNEVLEESLAGFYGVFTSVGIAPNVRISEDHVVRSLDRKALRRVFDNVLSNASKYSKGDLEVELTAKGEIRFSNTAPDLDSVQTQRLFDRFFSIENARGSYGLGLSIARLLTEQMGGSINATYNDGVLCVTVRF